LTDNGGNPAQAITPRPDSYVIINPLKYDHRMET
jgi:hypothetical protein